MQSWKYNPRNPLGNEHANRTGIWQKELDEVRLLLRLNKAMLDELRGVVPKCLFKLPRPEPVAPIAEKPRWMSSEAWCQNVTLSCHEVEKDDVRSFMDRSSNWSSPQVSVPDLLCRYSSEDIVLADRMELLKSSALSRNRDPEELSNLSGCLDEDDLNELLGRNYMVPRTFSDIGGGVADIVDEAAADEAAVVGCWGNSFLDGIKKRVVETLIVALSFGGSTDHKK